MGTEAPNTNKMEKQKKIYCGSGKKRSDSWLSVSINIDKIQDHIQEYNGSKFVKLNVNVNRDADQYGKDVSISIDNWKPESKTETSDLPF